MAKLQLPKEEYQEPIGEIVDGIKVGSMYTHDGFSRYKNTCPLGIPTEITVIIPGIQGAFF